LSSEVPTVDVSRVPAECFRAENDLWGDVVKLRYQREGSVCEELTVILDMLPRSSSYGRGEGGLLMGSVNTCRGTHCAETKLTTAPVPGRVQDAFAGHVGMMRGWTGVS